VERFHGLDAPDSVELVMHLHRYSFAAAFCHDKKVLDFGSGNGYGSYLLAQYAKSVEGVDRDADAIAVAKERYRAKPLEFRTIDSAHLDSLESHAYDVVTCFEMLEHVAEPEQEELLATFARVLRPDGILLLSTPNLGVKQRHYERFPDWKNPYHIRELDAEELRALCRRHFATVELLPQVLEIASMISGCRSAAVDLPETSGWVNLVCASQKPLELPEAKTVQSTRHLQLFEEHLLREQWQRRELEQLTALLTEEKKRSADERVRFLDERARLLDEIDRTTSGWLTAKAEVKRVEEKVEEVRRAYVLLEQSLGHRVSLLFDRYPLAKRAIIALGNAIIK
jgi:SAM-dependent methyltransferase